MSENMLNHKNKFCGNCGKKGHIYKNCKEPTISNGIIGIKIEDIDNDILDKVIDELKSGIKFLNRKDKNNHGIKLHKDEDLELLTYFKDKIKFTLICRKHSVGFMEFVRGRYETDNIEGIVFLFKQMTADEFKKIKNAQSFKDLWNDVWINDNQNPKHVNEFKVARDKFDKLKDGVVELDLSFFLENVNPSWKDAEWGFPKGRRNKQELNIDCAKREFNEESGFNYNEYEVINNIEPLEEEFIGTNGIKYKHIYYIGIIKSDKEVKLDLDNQHQIEEIGDIGYFSYESCMNMIRPYHIERRSLLTMLYIHILDILINMK